MFPNIVLHSDSGSIDDVKMGGMEANQNQSQKEHDFYYTLYIVIVPVVFALIVLLGLLGNLLVIYVICSRKELQTATNLLLINLAKLSVLLISHFS